MWGYASHACVYSGMCMYHGLAIAGIKERLLGGLLACLTRAMSKVEEGCGGKVK